MLGHFASRRRATRWLVLLAGFALLFVVTVGVIPHGDEDQRCLACKARHQPIDEFVDFLVLAAPPSTASRSTVEDARLLPSVVIDSASPRAPPA